MSYRGEQEYKPNAHRLEPVKIPAFIKCEVCPGCQGRRWKKEQGGYSMIVCPICQGKGKLPISNADGQWEKK